MARIGRVLVCGGAVAATAGGAALGAVRGGGRWEFPTPVVVAPPEGTVSQLRARDDSVRARRLLEAARGTNGLVCALSARTLDGHGGWWSGSDADFRAGEPTDSLVRDVTRWAERRETDATAVPLLRAALADPDPCVRRLAAPLLGRVRDPAATQAMLAALAASDPIVRETGALALGFAEDPRTILPLAERLHDDVPRVRATAAWALGAIENAAAVQPLIAALKDGDAMVRQSAAHALGEIEDAAAIPALTDLLKSDRDPTVRRAAAWALGEIIG